jgi:ATP-dependent helicase YprA (DUF1998 family)
MNPGSLGPYTSTKKKPLKREMKEKGFVVTSGTGSGKSLTYISTIFNFLFKNPNKLGIKAIIVYPLNALINSQESALNVSPPPTPSLLTQ